MITLAINWAQVGMQAGYLLASLSILVVMHEFGHYITAKWFKCRVEKFYLFFDPWFSIAKKKIGETVYGIGWLPLGGYVKIAGMVDESMDKEQLKQPPQPWEFRSKPAWQRLIIMLGGVTVNVLLAFLIYAMILYKWGETKLPVANVPNGIWVTDSVMLNIGFKSGDKVVAVDGEAIEYFDDIPAKIIVGETVSIVRDGKKIELPLPKDLIGKLVEKKGKNTSLLQQRIPLIIGGYGAKDTTNAKTAGLMGMDKIVMVDSTTVIYFDQLMDYLATKKNDTVDISYSRDGGALQRVAVPVSSEGKIGIGGLTQEQYDSMGVFTLQKTQYGFWESFPAGVRKTGERLDWYIQQAALLLKPSSGAYKGLGGFKAMASIFPKNEWDWQVFWNITAFFSIILAFMNLLPIPALDGGHVLFTLIEMVTGRKPSDKFLEYAQIVGMVLLLGLMLYANGNDWFGWGKNK
ncbi:MAG: RIP metalloprotease RseP [Chitinophagaceae bacterium]